MAYRHAYKEKRELGADQENQSPQKKFVSPVFCMTDGEMKKFRLSSSESVNSLENQLLSMRRKSVLSELVNNSGVRPSEDFTDDSQMDLDQAFVKADNMQAYVSKPKQEDLNGV